MNRVRVKSSSELAQPQTTPEQHYDDSALQGVASHMKLLLKIIQEHKDACYKEKNDGRRMLRVATMMTILDNIRTRIQKCQSFGNKGSEAELQRCNTDLRPNHSGGREKRHSCELVVDEKEKLRKELSASMAARKSLEIMCSSLGKEKEIMAAELSRKVQELNGLEEHINDLKAQNQMLRKKVRECALEHKDEKCGGGGGGLGGGESHGNAVLQERNRVLSEQLSRSIDGYRLMKRKLKEVREENMMMRSTIDEMRTKVGTSLERVRKFKECMLLLNNPPADVQEEIVALENLFERFEMMVRKHDQKEREEEVT